MGLWQDFFVSVRVHVRGEKTFPDGRRYKGSQRHRTMYVLITIILREHGGDEELAVEKCKLVFLPRHGLIFDGRFYDVPLCFEMSWTQYLFLACRLAGAMIIQNNLFERFLDRPVAWSCGFNVDPEFVVVT